MTDPERAASVDPLGAWATPLDAPMYPRFPVPFRDLELLTLQYRTDADAIRRLVPEPLVPTGDTVLRVPTHASKSWTITEIDGGTFGDDTLILTRYPGGTTNLDDLNVLAPAPTTR